MEKCHLVETAEDSNRHKVMVYKDDIREAKQLVSCGVSHTPLKDAEALLINLGNGITTPYLISPNYLETTPSSLKKPGETLVYSVSDGNRIKSSIHLKEDGELHIESGLANGTNPKATATLDKDGKITINSNNKSTLTMDNEGNITISGELVTIQAKGCSKWKPNILDLCPFTGLAHTGTPGLQGADSAS